MQTAMATIGFVISNYITFFVKLDGLTFRQRSVLFAAAFIVYLLLLHRRQTEKQDAQPSPFQAVPTMAATFVPMPVMNAPQHVYETTRTADLRAASHPDLVVINQWFHRRNILVQATSHAVTPDYDFFGLVKSQMASWAQLTESVREDLAYEIYAARRKRGMQNTDPVKVSFETMPPALRVTRPVREVLPWSARLRNLPPGVAQYGAKLVAGELHPVTVDTKKQRHVTGIFSSSGGGKSNLLRAAALSLIESSDPARDEFYFIDLDTNQFVPFARLPQVKMVAETEHAALCLLLYLKRLMDEDKDLTDQTHRYLIIDELQMMTEFADDIEPFVKVLADLANRWRKRNGCIIAATQDPSGNNFPRAMQKNIKVILAGSTEDDSYLKRYLHMEGANALRGEGDFLIKDNGGIATNFKGFLLDKSTVMVAVDEMVARFGEDSRTLDLASEADELEGDDTSDDLAVADMMPPSDTMSEQKQRQRETITMILKMADENDGEFPPQHQIRKWHETQYGKQLGNQTAKKLFKLARQQREESL